MSKFTVEFAKRPAALDRSSDEDIAAALAKILNQDLEFFWGSKVTVTPERTTV
jgi:hypothetical protein